jgi:hypothetical protein
VRGLAWASAPSSATPANMTRVPASLLVRRDSCLAAHSVWADPARVPIRPDITDPTQVAAAADQCTDLTFLINNAGIFRARPLLGNSSTQEVLADRARRVPRRTPLTPSASPDGPDGSAGRRVGAYRNRAAGRGGVA